MIEKDVAHLRFLYNVTVKGSALSSDDIDFVLKMKREIDGIKNGVDELLELQRKKEELL